MAKTALGLVAFVFAVASAPAQFTWSDGFEPYTLGSLCSLAGCGNAGSSGGWAGWDNVAAAAGTVVDSTTAPGVTAHSGTRFLQIGAPTDAVQPFSLNNPTTYPQNSGVYELSAWTYIPTNGVSATTWFIVNNSYNHLGPYTWSLQIQFTTGGVIDVDRPAPAVPIVFNQWVQLRVLVDLNTNVMVSLYNGQQVSSGTWTVGGGPLAIANIDLYTGGTIYYDDLSLTPTTALYQRNSTQATLMLNGVQGTTLTPAITAVTAGSAVTLIATSTLVGAPFDIAVVASAPVPAFLVTPGAQIVNVDILNPSLFFLNSGTPAPNFLPFPGTITAPFTAPPGPLTLSAQMIIIDGSHPDGFRLSQAVELKI